MQMNMMTTDDLINRAKALHGEKFSYDATNLKMFGENAPDISQTVIVTCPTHGNFSILPMILVTNQGASCKKCWYESLEFMTLVKRAHEIPESDEYVKGSNQHRCSSDTPRLRVQYSGRYESPKLNETVRKLNSVFGSK